MPRFLIPKRSSAHRIASIALYRALLSQSCTVPINNEQQTALRNAIRRRFRDNKELQSSRQIELVFNAGYEVLDLLDASVGGDSESTAIITSFLAETSSCLTRSLRIQSIKPKARLSSLACPSAKESMLAIRPRPFVPGIRRIPILASASGIPFLRIKKPQPANLSRVLKQKLVARNKGFDRRNILQNYWMPLAIHEDTWDEILHSRLGPGSCSFEPTWTDMVKDALQDEKILYDQRMLKDARMAQEMQKIIDQEIELARLESIDYATVGRTSKGLS
ncbi:hypothetical protein AOQ84DRAFT_374859 [Glonium stellatum]|uniref:Complex 1 LYR protein domain-containing protein n=1 Tax=Glonium stellatum TaxID=574774 RepID=A0A8E2F5U0_9PEZI|nr:hypothetical protein AOQ84DRAFT_374859 [Glonium stellatum]